MSAVSRVPVVTDPAHGALTARHALRAVADRGPWTLLRASLHRFRFGDGFSHSRALGFQFALSVLPLLIAFLGVTRLLEIPSLRSVLRRTVLELTPGASEPLVRDALPTFGDGSDLDVSALALGAVVAVVALTTAMGQLQRGANRIYGIDRDRPSTAKYGRALVTAGAVGLPAMIGSLVLVTAGTFAAAVESQYGIDDDLVALAGRPTGVALVVGALTAMLRFGPARRQPGWSFLLLGGLLSFALWTSSTLLLGGFLQLSARTGSLYGPLTGVMALLVWAQLTSASILLGHAVSAELETAAGAPDADATTAHPAGSTTSATTRTSATSPSTVTSWPT